MKALEILARKIAPDLASVEQRIDSTVRSESSEPTNPRQLARAILNVLGGGLQEGGSLPAIVDDDRGPPESKKFKKNSKIDLVKESTSPDEVRGSGTDEGVVDSPVSALIN